MSVRLDGRPFFGDVNTVLTKDLAVRQVGVSIDTLLGPLKVLVEEVQHVDITGRELSGVHFVVSEHTGSFVHGSGVSRANIGFTITGFNTRVNPAILFRNCHQILDVHISLSSSCGNLRNSKTFGAETLVESRSVHSLDGGRDKVGKSGEENG